MSGQTMQRLFCEPSLGKVGSGRVRREESISVLWYHFLGVDRRRSPDGCPATAFCAVDLTRRRAIAINCRILPFLSNRQATPSDQPCETAIERDTGGFVRRPDRSDRSRRPPRHAGAVRTAPCQGVSFRAPARAG